MAENKEKLSIFKNVENNIVAFVAVFVILMLIVPWSKAFIDIFMICNIAISILVLLQVLFTPKASSFSSFPRVLLFATIFGLGINVASTRLILSTGDMALQSEMVKAFANIVTGGGTQVGGNVTGSGSQLVVGFVIFIILIVIQVVVITKGATRVAEVAARFSLDSMNSKMFAVDSELNSGSITEEEARKKKAEIQRESDFYSAMDGSSKFVSGNVKAGIFITAINLIAGIITGFVLYHVKLQDVFRTYTTLTIGDGLLSQIPSLLLSFATGVLVTGSNSTESLGLQLKKQFSHDGWVYIITGMVLIIMAVIPSFPHILLFISGAILVLYGVRIQRLESQSFQKKLQEEQANKGKITTSTPTQDIDNIAPPDQMTLELGIALIPLVDKEKGAELLNRVAHIRKEIALDLGIVVPKIRIMDNMQLEQDEYCFKIKGIEAGRAKIKIGYQMCMNVNGVTQEIRGEKTTDPTFGMSAIWVSDERRPEAEAAGYVCVDPPTIIATHLTSLIRTHASEILDRQAVSKLVEKLKETSPVVVDEAMNTCKFTYGDVQKVLQNLLKEEVSVRNLSEILETMSNFANISHDTWFLSEKVRIQLGTQICMQYADKDRVLRVLSVSQQSSQKILEHRFAPADGSRPVVAFDPVDGRNWIKAVSSQVSAVKDKNLMPILMCPEEIRPLVKASTEREMPGLVVLSISEVATAGNNIKVEVVGEINF